MSITNTEIKHHGMGTITAGRKNKKDYFTLFQATVLILLTLGVSTAGWFAAGKYYFWTGVDKKRVNQQLEYLEQKVQAEPKNLDYRVALGYTYFLKGKNEKAIKELNQVLEIDKRYYDAHYNLGLVLADEGRFDEALDAFQKCIEISPKDYKGYLQKGIVYRKLKMYPEAVQVLDKASIMMPGRADIIYEIGMVAEAKGDKETAAQIYKEALSFDPLFKDAVAALKRVQKK